MPFLVPLIILAIASSACANDEDEELLKGIVEALSAIERFHLWADCGPMSLQVEGLDENAAKIGLSKEATETAMRSRLRAADLYTDKFWISLSGGTRVVRPSLYLEVTVVGPAFSVSLQYRKFLRDVYHSGLQEYARTWIQSATGVHAGDANYILSAVSLLADKFIDEYLRVNENACGAPPGE